MACANYWTSPFQVGSHHLARGLAHRGWRVGFVSDPISPIHVLGAWGAQLAQRYALYRSGGRWDTDRNVWAYVPGALLTPQNKPLLKSMIVERNWPYWTCPSLSGTVKTAGFGHVDVLYCDSPKHLPWINNIQRKTLVYRVADNAAGFSRTTPAASTHEKELAQKADLVVYTAQTLAEYVHRLAPRRAAHLPNGVDFRHFAEGVPALPQEYRNIPRPIAVYAGYMDAWFDYALMDNVAASLPEVSFVLIGGTRSVNQRLTVRPNIHLLGTRPFSQLPSFLRHANVGIIPFDARGYPELVHSIHPLKLYEYMASGLPVVSSRWNELEKIGSPARLCDTAEEFSAAVFEATTTAPDSEGLIRFASMHDWSRRVARLLELAQVDSPA